MCISDACALSSRGYWHGEVLVRLFNVPNATEQQIRKFTHDVAALKHSRHENVILFMGVCSRPPHLAVVTRWEHHVCAQHTGVHMVPVKLFIPITW